MKCVFKNWRDFFKAVCDENRQNILKHLKTHKSLNASDIMKKIKLAQPTVSHHLKILVDAGVILAKKQGKETYYEISKNRIHDCCGDFIKMFTSDK